MSLYMCVFSEYWRGHVDATDMQAMMDQMRDRLEASRRHNRVCLFRKLGESWR